MNKGEAIKILKDFHDESALFSVRTALETLHPELKESEDERIRKELTKHLKEGVEGYMPAGDSSDYRRWLAWLEKQGKSSDQIHYWTEEEIEPIISDYLRGAEHYGGMIARLRCLKPKSLEKQGEQKPTIEMKSAEESLGIDSDTYNEIVDECIYSEQKTQRMISAEAKEAMYGKPTAWSEEDEVKINRIVACLENLNVADNDILLKDVDWLKSLKGRIPPQPKWNEENMFKVQRICEYLNEAKKYYADITEVRECIDWLKSLKDRYTWKPSDEQMKALHDLNLTGNISYVGQGQVLIELYNILKKLTE